MKWVIGAAIIVVLGIVAFGGFGRKTGLVARETIQPVTPLAMAARRADLVEVTRLLDAGADPNATMGKDRWTALVHVCCAATFPDAGYSQGARTRRQYLAGLTRRGERYAGVVALLVDRGADLRAGFGTLGWDATVLHAAAANGSMPVVEVLLDHGVSPNFRDDKGRTALHSVAQLYSLSLDSGTAKRLIERGADVNARDNDGLTPLHRAACSGVDAVRFFIQNGADVNSKDILGLRPLDYAEEPEVAAVLRRAGGKGLGE